MPSEYFKLLDLKDRNKKSLRVHRVVMIDFNHYYLLDYYPDVTGQPLLLIVKKGLVTRNPKKLKFPSIEQIVPIFREVTNEKEYMIESMARIDYEMPEKDREGTQLEARRKSFSETTKQRTSSNEEEKSLPNGQSPTKPQVLVLDYST